MHVRVGPQNARPGRTPPSRAAADAEGRDRAGSQPRAAPRPCQLEAYAAALAAPRVHSAEARAEAAEPRSPAARPRDVQRRKAG